MSGYEYDIHSKENDGWRTLGGLTDTAKHLYPSLFDPGAKGTKMHAPENQALRAKMKELGRAQVRCINNLNVPFVFEGRRLRLVAKLDMEELKKSVPFTLKHLEAERHVCRTENDAFQFMTADTVKLLRISPNGHVFSWACYSKPDMSKQLPVRLALLKVEGHATEVPEDQFEDEKELPVKFHRPAEHITIQFSNELTNKLPKAYKINFMRLAMTVHKEKPPTNRHQLDHITPLWEGGANDLTNVQWLSEDAHKIKTAAEKERRDALLKQLKQAKEHELPPLGVPKKSVFDLMPPVESTPASAASASSSSASSSSASASVPPAKRVCSVGPQG